MFQATESFLRVLDIFAIPLASFALDVEHQRQCNATFKFLEYSMETTEVEHPTPSALLYLISPACRVHMRMVVMRHTYRRRLAQKSPLHAMFNPKAAQLSHQHATMKQRITYVVPDPESFDPESLSVRTSSLELRDVKAAKEHRITFGLSELPVEVCPNEPFLLRAR